MRTHAPLPVRYTLQRRPRVLLADDYPAILAALDRLLGPVCDIVAKVADAPALLEALELHRPDVIVLDLGLPPFHGLETCRQVKNAAPATSVIIFTASGDAAIAEQALNMGATALVSKHRVADDLLPAVLRAAAERTSHDSPKA